MPKPTPDYIPGEIRDQIAALGYAGVMEYSEHIGLKPQRLISVFSGRHTALKNYWRLSHRMGVSLDELAAEMASIGLEKRIKRLIERENKSARAISLELGAGSGFLTKKMQSGPGLNGLETYIEVAQALGWSLQKLVENCLRETP